MDKWITKHIGSPVALWICSIAIMLMLPMIISKNYLYVVCLFLIMTLYAMSLNLLFGYAGLLSFGQSAFFGVGGYTLAIITANASLPLIVGLIASPLLSACAALLIGYFCVQRIGVYFSILALAFSQLVFYVICEWYGFTGGDNGISVTLPQYLLSMEYYYYFILIVVGICLLLVYRIVISPFGKTIQSVREDPERATFMGVDVKKMQLITFIISGAFAGVSGALLVIHQRMAFPDMAGFQKSFEPILMTLLGGVYNYWGPMVGAALFVFLEFFLSTYTEYSFFVLGLVVLSVVLVLPGGIVGFVVSRVNLRRNQR